MEMAMEIANPHLLPMGVEAMEVEAMEAAAKAVAKAAKAAVVRPLRPALLFPQENINEPAKSLPTIN